jgi:hypothetical protein
MTTDQRWCWLAKVDNIAYAHMIGERLRTRVEQSGHVELSDDDVHQIQIDRRTFGLLVGGGLLVSIATAYYSGSSYPVLEVIFFTCWLSVVAIELQLPGRNAQDRGKAVLLGTGKSFLGFVAFGAMLGIANVL